MSLLFEKAQMLINTKWNSLVNVNVENDDDARLGRLFNVLMVISAGIVLSLTFVFLSMIPLGLGKSTAIYIATSFPFTFIPLSIYCIIQAKHGRIRSSVALYVWFNLIAISAAVFLFDGIISPGWILYIWTITIAGILLTPIYSLWMTCGVVSYYFVLFFLTRSGYYQPPLSFGIGRDYVEIACLLIMLVSTVGLLTFLNMRSLRDSMMKLNNEISEHKKTEIELNESREKYLTVADFTYDWEYWLGANDKYVYVSPSCKRITGYDSNEFLEDPNLFDSIILPQDRIDFMQHKENVMKDGSEVCTIDFRIITRHGIERWISHTCQSVISSEGKWLGRRGTNRDITEQRKTEEALRENEKRYRLIVEHLNQGYYEADRRGIFTYCNPALLLLAEYTGKEIIGTNSFRLVADEHRKQIITAYSEWAKQRRSDASIEFLVQTKSGRKFWVEQSTHFEFDSEGKLIKASNIIKDVNERKLAEQEIQKINKELGELNANKDKFFSILAHDLKNPFHGFLSLTELMADDTEEFSQAELFENNKSLNKAAQNLYKLLENLLEWAQMQNGSMSFAPQEFDLRIVVSRCIETIKDSAAQKGITIFNEVKEKQEIFADEKMIDSVFRNLLSNAIKFTRRDGKIIVSTKASANEKIEVTVSDTGVGMLQKDVNRLFKVEEKVSAKGTEGEPSTGLGLLLCKEFVEKNGGTISVESEIDKGSRFVFTVPAVNNTHSIIQTL